MFFDVLPRAEAESVCFDFEVFGLNSHDPRSKHDGWRQMSDENCHGGPGVSWAPAARLEQVAEFGQRLKHEFLEKTVRNSGEGQRRGDP